MHVCVFELYVCVHVYPYVGMSVCLCILCDVFNSCDKLSHRWSRGGIQLHHQSGDVENLLIFPHGSSGIIYSDDHGQTWQNGNHSSGVGGECQVSKHF